jgi:hypothetical protein
MSSSDCAIKVVKRTQKSSSSDKLFNLRTIAERPGRAGAEIASWHKLHAAMGKHCAVAVPGRIKNISGGTRNYHLAARRKIPGPRARDPLFGFGKEFRRREQPRTLFIY